MIRITMFILIMASFCNDAWCIDKYTSRCDELAASPLDRSRRGVGVEKIDEASLEEALEACEIAVEENEPDGVTFYQLGRVYSALAEHRNKSENNALSAKYYYLAMNNNHPRAGTPLASLALLEHITIPEEPSWNWLDLSIAASQHSAKLGDKDGATHLAWLGGNMYYGKNGIRRDETRGYTILQRASQLGSRDANLVLKDIARSDERYFEGLQADRDAEAKKQFDLDMRLLQHQNR